MRGNSYNLLPLEKAHRLRLSLLSGTPQGVDSAETTKSRSVEINYLCHRQPITSYWVDTTFVLQTWRFWDLDLNY